MGRKRAFTLVEMLVVIAIMAILAAVLFPVFRSVKESAYKTVCIQNFQSALLATSLYSTEYDDMAVLANYKSTSPRTSQNDRTWVQLLLPYTKDFRLFRCPGDYANRPRPEATFDQDLVPGDTLSQYYSASLRSNIGYNFMYLAPSVRQDNNAYGPKPRSLNQASNPSRTLIFADSVWERDSNGNPRGGGSYVVVPPCRYLDTTSDTFKQGAEEVFTAGFNGWDTRNLTGPKYGNAWPWHNGRVNIGRLDGGAQAIHVRSLAAGCDGLDAWQGRIRDSEAYMWDLF